MTTMIGKENKENLYELDNDVSNRLGYNLLRKEIVDLSTLKKALLTKWNENTNSKDNKNTARNLAQILVQDFQFDHDLIYREVAELFAFKIFDIDADNPNSIQVAAIKKLLEKVNKEIKKQLLTLRILPVKYDSQIKDKLIFAAVDPTIKDISKIAYSMNAKSYDIVYLPLEKYKQIIDQVIQPENEFLKKIIEEEYEYKDSREETNIDEGLLEVEINKSALINLFEGALVEGVRKGASDIHITPLNSRETNISFRIDGRLNLWLKQDNTLPEAIIAVVKDRSRGLDRFERETGQDGFIQREVDGHIIRFRVSILPIAGSEIKNKFESIVIRILDDRKVISDLNELGLIGYARSCFEKAISRPQGMVILTGPTGCGKSTTIIAALHHVMDPSLNVLTVEDPIEYIIKGARQIKLGHKMGFDQAIRSILRHDPDIVLVGEVRDRETADIAIKLANTGHLTFTTLHTNDAPSVVARLYKMGIEPFLLAYSINVIVAQRLVRKLCNKCKKVHNIDEHFLTKLKLNPVDWKGVEVFEPNGCERCGFTGFSGRIAVHETLYFNKEISQIIFDAGDKIDEEAIRVAAKKDGMLTLRESGFERVKMGLTSFEEVLSNTTE